MDIVVEDYEDNNLFLDSLSRLNNAYGIGLIKLNVLNPIKSEIVIPARYNENVDVNFMNFLSTYNVDYYNFISEIMNMLKNREINTLFFDRFSNNDSIYNDFFF